MQKENKNIKIYKNTKIYVVAPAATATGGPELLHQLLRHLRKKLNIDAYMYYIPTDHPRPVHSTYKLYGNPFVKDIEDNEENILVVPELYSCVSILKNYRKIRKIVWWLSVDNYYNLSKFSSEKLVESFLMRLVNKILRLTKAPLSFDLIEYALGMYKKKYELKKDPLIHDVFIHLAQSRHAINHLRGKGIKNILYLSDYLNEEFLKTKTDLSKKANIVIYNPVKGLKFTKTLMKKANKIKFIPIDNMRRKEVIKILQKAKVYIDFGNHPGKDRLPREAAILKCCLITDKRGSAGFYEDVSIPNEYKFEDKRENIPLIVNKIKDCFNNYGKSLEDFEGYRNIILKEKKNFIKDLRKVFIKK